MRSVFWFIIVNIVAFIGYIGALSMKIPWIGFSIAFGVWLIYLCKITNSKN